MKYYMHLIDGRPGIFYCDQIVFMDRKIKTSEMCKSLSTIKRQQKKSREFRKAQGWNANYAYSHIIIEVSE